MENLENTFHTDGEALPKSGAGNKFAVSTEEHEGQVASVKWAKQKLARDEAEEMDGGQTM